MEAVLLLKEIEEIIARLPGMPSRKRCVLDDGGNYCCSDCCDHQISDGPFFLMDGPIDCTYCGEPLEYHFSEDQTAFDWVDWLYSLLQREIPIPDTHWYDLRQAVQRLPIPHDVWEKVAYIVHLGVDVDHLIPKT